MSTKSPLLNVMCQAAQKAGRKLNRDFGEVENLQVSKKGPADFVSNADRMAEKILFEALGKARPKYGFLMEESGAREGSDTSNTWIVDPLDGTTNFLHGIPHFASSIGLERDGEAFAGVVYEPVHDQMFWAEKGGGAFLNGRRVRVSARGDMSASLFATGLPFMGRDHAPSILARVRTVMDRSAGIRRFGAASLDLAWVAAGRYEGFWETGLSAWDMAAGSVLIKEAGGFVSDLDGGKRYLDTGHIVAANDQLHASLLKTLKSATR